MCPKKSFRVHIGINIVNLSVQKKNVEKLDSTTKKLKSNILQAQTTLLFQFYVFLNIISCPTCAIFLPVLGYFITEIKKMGMDTVQTDTTYKEKNLLDGTCVTVLKN